MNQSKIAYTSARWLTLSSTIKAFLQFAQISIIAHLLSPQDLGLGAVVLSVTSISQVFADLGIGSALMHRRNICQSTLSTLYFVNIFTSSILFLAIFFSAPSIAHLYHNPRLTNLLQLSSLSILIASFGTQQRILSEKYFNYKKLALSELISSILAFSFTIFSANIGLGVYSIVIGYLTLHTVNSVCMATFVSSFWRPTSIIIDSQIIDFLKYGGWMTGTNIISSLNSELDVLIGSRYIPSISIGFYTQANQLTLGISRFINPIASRVVTSLMSDVNDDSYRLKQIYLKCLNFTASMNFPIYFIVFTFASDLVPLVLGNQWLSAVPLLRISAVWAFFRSIANPVGSLLIAKGRADLNFHWNAGVFLTFVPVVFVSSQYGVQTLAISSAVYMALIFFPLWQFIVLPLCGCTFSEYLGNLLQPLFVCLFALSPLLYFLSLSPSDPPILFLKVMLSLGLYMAVSCTTNKSWITAISNMLPRRSIIKSME